MRVNAKGIRAFVQGLVCFVITFAVPQLGVAQGTGAPLVPGDLVVSDQDFFSRVVYVNPATGAQTLISSGGSLHVVRGLAIDANGQILATVRFSFPSFLNGIVKVDPVTGTQTVLSSGGNFQGPADVAVLPNGDILVADFFAGVIKVNPTTGAQTVISSGGNFTAISGIAVAKNGDIYVSDFDNFNIGPGEVIRVNPVTGAQTVVTTGGNLLNPASIEMDRNGDLLVCNQTFTPSGTQGIIRVNPVTGAQTVAFSAANILPTAIAIDANGDWIVANFNGSVSNSVIKVNPSTGTFTPLSEVNNFLTPVGIAIVPVPVVVIPVTIDIKPGAVPNSIKLGSGGNVPVAIFGTESFDVTEVKISTVTLAGAPVKLNGQGAPQASFTDVNGDGRTDLLLHFITSALNLTATDTEAVLEGETFDGDEIRGVDSVKVIP